LTEGESAIQQRPNRIGFKKILEFERAAMKRQNQKAVILIVCVAIMLIAGCNEQNTSKSGIRKSRLMAAENKRLEKEIEKHKELLANCLEEKGDLQEQMQKSGQSRMINLLEAVTEKNAELHLIIDGLEAEIEQLDKELEELKKQPVNHKP
jgi:dynactin complex subunit